MLSEASYPRHPGGAGKNTHLLAAGLVSRGHTVHILCESHEETEHETLDGVEVHRLRLPFVKNVASRQRERLIAESVYGYIRSNLPIDSLDIVHDSGGFLSFYYPVAYQLRHEHRKPLLLHLRYLLLKHQMSGSKRYDPFNNRLLRMELMIDEQTQGFPIRFSDGIICSSQADADFVRDVFKPTAPLTVIPDAVDTSYQDSPRAAELRQALAPDGEPLILFGGRIDSDIKGGSILLRSLPTLLHRFPNLKLILLGKNPVDFRSLINRFKHNVIWRGWIGDAAELAALFGAVDAVVVPSRYETFGLMCAEAMAVGTLVIASPIGGLKDMISHGVNGFLFQGQEPESWSKQLTDYCELILGDPLQAVAMRSKAKEYAQTMLDIQVVARKVEILYERIGAEFRSGEKAKLKAPLLTESEQSRYLSMINEWVGSEATVQARALLREWGANPEQWCLQCTRRRQALSVRVLLGLRRNWIRRWWLKRTGKWIDEVDLAVKQTCPLNLLQKVQLANHTRDAESDF